MMREYAIKSLLNETLQINNQTVEIEINEQKVMIKASYHNVYGLGERYNTTNQKGNVVVNKVEEKFCNQGEKTYFPIPFFFTDLNFGIFVKTNRVISFEFNEIIEINIENCADNDALIIFEGQPKEIISDFISMTGKTALPPKWTFGPWISGHRWKSEEMVYEQLEKLKSYDFPATVIVLEQWSDEATFYVFNGAKYEPKEGPLKYEDFTFDEDGLWHDPKAMIDAYHENNIKVLLWQCPIIKELEENEPLNDQHTIDQKFVQEHHLIVRETDGVEYRIPKGNWFPGSMIPDWSNDKMIKWWFEKRQYLLDIGVDGFKTDGGEFIHKENTVFASGLTGKDMVNKYSADYVAAYHNFVGDKGVVFSRAGYLSQQLNPIQWAGDQQSTYSELQSVLRAGINCGLSGQTFWSFDIGGFAGELPSIELYKRSTQFATFVPVMQYHSEPVGGQFSALMPTKKFNNERTPWNIADYYEDETVLDDIRYYHHLRMNLIPYIYSEAVKCVNSNTVMMKHLVQDYPNDETAKNIADQYLLGGLLVAPLTIEGAVEREIYFPEGEWYNFFTHELVNGSQTISVEANVNQIPVYVKSGDAVVLNLGDSGEIPSKVSNDVENLTNVIFQCFGKTGSYHFIDELGNNFTLAWANNTYSIKGTCTLEFSVRYIYE